MGAFVSRQPVGAILGINPFTPSIAAKIFSVKPESRRARPAAASPKNKKTSVGRVIGLAFGSLGLLVLAALSAVLIFQLYYSNRVMPGIKLAGIDLSGMRPEQVFDTAHAQSYYYRAQALNLKIGDSIFVYRPADFGVGLDPAETTRKALRIGHQDDLRERFREQFDVYWNGLNLQPVTIQNEALADSVLKKLAERTQRAPVNARIELENNTAREIQSQPGARLDIRASHALVRGAIDANRTATGTFSLVLPVTNITPTIASAAEAAAEASRVVGSDLTVLVPKWDDKGSPIAPVEAFKIRAADLPQFVTIEEPQNGESGIQIRTRRERLRPLVESLAPAVVRATQNARFKFDVNAAKLIVLTPSVEGRGLDIEKSLDAIEAAMRSDNRTAVIAITTTAPAINDATTAESLGIKQLVAEAITSFSGSSDARRKNVAEAAKRFQGVVIPPGATFSFNNVIGNISIEDGFEEGLIIVGNRTVKGVGGGVCQVSTTLYQAALKAGLSIVERYNHGYRVSYYERGLGPGYDATVFSPYADFKFVNDLSSNLLIETIYDPARVSLTFRLYGTKDGRDVTFSPTSITDEVKHGLTIYEPDTSGELAASQVKQTDFAANGATISFDRTVSKGGQILIQERIRSTYQPWQARFRYGPGFTSFPPDAVDQDGNPLVPTTPVITPTVSTP